MPRIKFVLVGHTKSSFLREGEIFYLERLRRYVSVEWIEVRPEKVMKRRSVKEILKKEGLSIQRRLLPKDYIIALGINGNRYTSRGFAARIEHLSLSGDPLCFLVGGPLGLSSEVLSRAHEVLSLSQLTLTHEMSRLILLEQLYRAYTIIKGEKYHK